MLKKYFLLFIKPPPKTQITASQSFYNPPQGGEDREPGARSHIPHNCIFQNYSSSSHGSFSSSFSEITQNTCFVFLTVAPSL